MKVSSVIYFSGCVLLTVFAISYCAVPLFHIKLPRYYPTLGQWKTTEEVGIPSIGWYGQTIFALLLSVSAGVLTFLILFYALRREILNTSVWYKLASGIAISAILLMMLYIAWHEYHIWVIPK